MPVKPVIVDNQTLDALARYFRGNAPIPVLTWFMRLFVDVLTITPATPQASFHDPIWGGYGPQLMHWAGPVLIGPGKQEITLSPSLTFTSGVGLYPQIVRGWFAVNGLIPPGFMAAHFDDDVVVSGPGQSIVVPVKVDLADLITTG